MNKIQKQRIVVVGGGFGGVKAAQELAAHPDKFDVTLISERPDFWYFPALYHTATGVSSTQTSIPLKTLFKDVPITIIEGKAAKLDRKAKTITLGDKTKVPYDQLVLALGVVTNYFGIPGLAEHTYGVKSIQEAERLKRHLHQQITANSDPELNYVVVGGGATGIELAGELTTYIRFIMKNHGVKDREVRICLVESGEHLMPRMPKSVGRSLERRLRKIGIKLYLGKVVEAATADTLVVSGETIRSRTVIWTAGQTNNPFFVENGFEFSPRKKVVVDEFMRADKDVFVIGDNAETEYSGMAQTAIYDAHFVAHSLLKEAEGKPMHAYRPKKPIYVTPAGHMWAAVEWGNMHIYGKLGWVLRHAGDFVAFTDIRPVPAAAGQWAQVLRHEHLCETCVSV